MLFLNGTLKESSDGIAGIESFVENRIDRMGDRHFDVIFLSELKSGDAGVGAFDHHADFFLGDLRVEPFCDQASKHIVAAKL